MATTAAPTTQEATPRSVARWFGPATSWTLLLLTAAPWGATGQVSGGLAALKLAGFLAAVVLAYSFRPKGGRVSLAGWLLIGYALVAAAGAYFTTVGLSDSLTRSARLAVTVAAAAWIAANWSLPRMLRATATFAVALSALALFGSFTGLAAPFDNRLTGFLPPLAPNSIGAVAGIGATITTLLWLRRELRSTLTVLSLAVLATTLVLAQSRTAVIATGVGIVVALCFGDRKRALGTVAVGAFFAAVLELAASLTRSDWNPLRGSRFRWDSTFSGRTMGWTRVVQLHRPWPRPALGDGLAAKYVPDPTVFGGLRPIDGSWHSAYYEAGLLGLILLAIAFLTVVAWTVLTREGRIAVPMLAFLVMDATLQSDINDVTFPFVVLAGVAGFVLTLQRRERPTKEATVERASYGPGMKLGNLAWAGITIAVVTLVVVGFLLLIGP